jgi:SAM-dependent methyltransferase
MGFVMEQTPAHEQHNPDLLSFIPQNARRIIEIGCSSGALAREFKKLVPDSDYLGVELDPHYAALAQRHCNRSFALDIEAADTDFWASIADRDCWIFGDVLEHLKDPWLILRKVRDALPENGTVVACIPNVQHWYIQANLSMGAFVYQPTGLMDKTHLRWFTRQTIVHLFQQAGLTITHGTPRIFSEPQRDRFLPIIAQMAEAAGSDPKQAVTDALPLQYVIRAVAA